MSILIVSLSFNCDQLHVIYYYIKKQFNSCYSLIIIVFAIFEISLLNFFKIFMLYVVHST